MEDNKIIALYLERSEDAIKETDKKYRRYCHSIAYSILNSDEDSEECVNDTYLKLWSEIPPTIPRKLSAFAGKITRNLALDRYEYLSAEKRGGNTEVILYEISDAIPSDTEDEICESALSEALNAFLSTLSPKSRRIFVKRYWYSDSISEISSACRMSEVAVKVSLCRTREKLKKFLEGKGIKI